MFTHVGIGFSRNINDEKAAAEAAAQAGAGIPSKEITFALVLSTIHYDPHKTLPVLRSVLGTAKLIGTSTAGIILSKSIETRGIAVLAIASDEIQFGTGCVENIHTLETPQAGTQLAQNCLRDFGPHGRHIFMFFADSRLKNISPLLKSVQEILGNIFPVIGAGSCDDFHFKDAFQICADKALRNSAAGIIMGGHMEIGVGSRHGWRPLGKPRTIDETDGNVIKSIDGKWACHIYEEYFGDEARGLRLGRLGQMAVLYPLGIFMEGSKQYLLRNAVDIRQDGSIVCQGDIPAGAEVHIMIGNKDSCKQAAFEAAREAQQNLLGKPPRLVIILESMARLKLLGRTAYQEVLKIREVFGLKVPMIGMYANGEICPMESVSTFYLSPEKFKKPLLQNESIVVLAVA